MNCCIKNNKMKQKNKVGRPKLNNVVFYVRCSPEQKKLLEEYAIKLKNHETN